jgi:hypothetical protein
MNEKRKSIERAGFYFKFYRMHTGRRVSISSWLSVIIFFILFPLKLDRVLIFSDVVMYFPLFFSFGLFLINNLLSYYYRNIFRRADFPKELLTGWHGKMMLKTDEEFSKVMMVWVYRALLILVLLGDSYCIQAFHWPVTSFALIYALLTFSFFPPWGSNKGGISIFHAVSLHLSPVIIITGLLDQHIQSNFFILVALLFHCTFSVDTFLSLHRKNLGIANIVTVTSFLLFLRWQIFHSYLPYTIIFILGVHPFLFLSAFVSILTPIFEETHRKKVAWNQK